MPSFVHPALLWGLGLLAVPILIHLINIWRHRRVEWAAMEFLLQSQKKNQRWIILRQLLLLLARVAALAVLVLILAQPLLVNRWGALLGAAQTQHIVLLDDSYSMSDRWAEATAFDRAKEAIGRIADQALVSGAGQSFTLLRFSRAAAADRGNPCDFFEQLMDADFKARLTATLAGLAPSQTAAGPAAALDAITRLLGEPPGTNRVLYLVSDFRTREWQEPAALKGALEPWRDWRAQLHFVHCVDAAHDNLAIVSLVPRRGTLAAGVPLFMEVAAKNFGREKVRDVSVLLEEDGNTRPAVLIDEIAPGAVETRRFLVNFVTAGQHVVKAALETDSVEADNSRFFVLDLPTGAPVLIVDNDTAGVEGRFLALALAPGGTVRTGLEPLVETPRFLANQPLDRFSAIYLANVGQLDQRAVAALEDYVRRGGGLGIFVGEATDSRFINEQLYRDGQGLFPLPLGAPAQLFVNRLEKTADLEVTDHPIFKVFAGERNSFLGTVGIERYFTARRGHQPAADSTVRVIAQLRNGAPLAVERKFGQGRVVAFLTTAAPVWNSWGRNPSFVVAMLEMQSHLATAPALDSRLVGRPFDLKLDPGRYQSRVRFVVPDADDGPLASDAVLQDGKLHVELADTPQSGVYEAQLTTTDGRAEVRRYAVNVLPDEGDLATLAGNRLAASLPGIAFDYHRPGDVSWAVRDLAGYNLSDGLLYFLVALLLGEQVLAYTASYHPRGGGGTRR